MVESSEFGCGLTSGLSCRRRATVPLACAAPMKARRLTAARRSWAGTVHSGTLSGKPHLDHALELGQLHPTVGRPNVTLVRKEDQGWDQGVFTFDRNATVSGVNDMEETVCP